MTQSARLPCNRHCWQRQLVVATTLNVPQGNQPNQATHEERDTSLENEMCAGGGGDFRSIGSKYCNTAIIQIYKIMVNTFFLCQVFRQDKCRDNKAAPLWRSGRNRDFASGT